MEHKSYFASSLYFNKCNSREGLMSTLTCTALKMLLFRHILYAWNVYWIWMLNVRATLTAKQIYNNDFLRMNKMFVSCIVICSVNLHIYWTSVYFTPNILIWWFCACIAQSITQPMRIWHGGLNEYYLIFYVSRTWTSVWWLLPLRIS